MSGWEPAESTTHEYDSSGRLVRSVTVREPEWTPAEVAVMVAWKRRQAEIGSHGVSMLEATDPASRGKWRVNESPQVDYVKLAMNAHRDAYYRSYPDAEKDRSAHIWYVKGRDE